MEKVHCVFTSHVHRYDTASRIPDQCIQRAGENVLALIKEITVSPLLADPGADKHGKVVFYDFLGLTTVVYPERIGVIINAFFSIASLVSLYFGVTWSSTSKHARSGNDDVMGYSLAEFDRINFKISFR